jgi:hypothetical protein
MIRAKTLSYAAKTVSWIFVCCEDKESRRNLRSTREGDRDGRQDFGAREKRIGGERGHRGQRFHERNRKGKSKERGGRSPRQAGRWAMSRNRTQKGVSAGPLCDGRLRGIVNVIVSFCK